MTAGELASPLPTPALRALEAEYEFLREVGRGGMATVYLARARASGRVVAIKTVATHRAHDPEAVARFAREARTVLTLDHPNIVRSYSVESLEGGALAIVMQHAAGGTLRDALRQAQGAGERIPVARVASILADVAAALAHAHERGVVHRDVKPENVFLDPRNGRALLSDFGIARSLDADNALTMTGSAIGTPTYMSPEQIDGLRVDGRSDVYALGLVGWELLAGSRPWEGDSLYTVIYKQKHEALAPLAVVRPDVPAALRDAIERALQKDPSERWPDAHAFHDALRAAVPPPIVAAEPRLSSPFAAAAAAATASSDPRASEIETEPAAVAATAVERDEADDAVAAEGAQGPLASVAADPAGDAPSYDDAPHDAAPDGPLAEPWRRDSWRLDRSVTAPARRTAEALRARYGSARPAARLAVPLALAVIAALAVRQGTRSRREPATAVDSSLTMPATGEVDTIGGAPLPAATAAPATAGESGTSNVATAAGRRAGSPAATPTGATTGGAAPNVSSPRAPVGLARYARTHGDSLALCRSAAPRDQRACFTALLADRDAPLNAAYVQLVRELRRVDPAAVAPLRGEETRWLADRDATCARDGRGREGALWAPSRAACLGDAADRRAAELSTRLSRLRAR
ncbi:MAG TPA: protein kinase [Gemmatimonadaceae bacterium]|nr:protein kinase [Gemmatimonadaceae bacterium]